MEQLIFGNKEKFIEEYLNDKREKLFENLNKLPNKELPFMESHLRALYFQTYFLLAEGFYNASLVLMGILLETITKELLFMNDVTDSELEKINFYDAIKKCKERDLLIHEELNFLKNINIKLRDPYIHYNKMKLSEGTSFLGGKISDPVPKIISLLEKTWNGELTEEEARHELIKDVKFEPMTSKDFRPLAQMGKSEFEDKEAINIFLEVDKFTRGFAKKYFKPEIKKEAENGNN